MCDSIILSALLLVANANAAQADSTFEQAADRGMVDLAANKPAAETAELLTHLNEINPGIVDGFAFFFSGPTENMLDGSDKMLPKSTSRHRKHLL